MRLGGVWTAALILLAVIGSITFVLRIADPEPPREVTITTGGDPGIMVGNGSGSNKPLLTTWSGGTASAQPTVANPTSSLATGSYAMPQTGVTLSDSTSSASICGTTNGDTPTASVSGTCDSDSGNEQTFARRIATVSRTDAGTI